MKMPEFTFLTRDQCKGPNKLYLFEEIGLNAEITDFANYFSNCNIYKKNNDGKNYGFYWTKTINDEQMVCVIGKNRVCISEQNDISIGIRLVISYSDIEENYYYKDYLDNGIIKFSFGEYIQDIADPAEQIAFNHNFDGLFEKIEDKSNFAITVKNVDKLETKIFDICKNWTNGNKYIKIPVNFFSKNKDMKNIYKKIFDENGYIFFLIKPIEWLMHKNDEYAVTEKILFSGIPFSEIYEKYKIQTNFSNSFIKYYIDNFFTKEIIQAFSKNYSITNSINNEFNIPQMNSIGSPKLFTAKELDLIKENKNNSINNKTTHNFPHLNSCKQNYGTYLTDKTYLENPAIGRENEIRELSKNLLIPKTGVILVGEAGVGKTSIVEGLAYQIQNNNICELLKNKGILNVNVGELLAGCQFRGDFEKKVTDLCNDLSNSDNIILFLDEIHMSLGAGTSIGQNIDMANMLKTYISNNQIKVIGCTTKEEHEKYFSNDKAFRRRFNIIDVKEPDELTLINILNATIASLTKKFNIKISMTENELEDIINLIIKLSSRKQKYIYDSLKNPDISIKIITSCFAYFAIENIKEAHYQDFINGIIDNPNINLLKLEIDNYLLNDPNNNEEIYEKKRQKIFVLNKKGNF